MAPFNFKGTPNALTTQRDNNMFNFFFYDFELEKCKKKIGFSLNLHVNAITDSK